MPTASIALANFKKFLFFLATVIAAPPPVDESLRINRMVNSFDAIAQIGDALGTAQTRGRERRNSPQLFVLWRVHKLRKKHVRN
jgi:hypothetical protein